MDFKRLEEISKLPEQQLTAHLVTFFCEIAKVHDSGKGLEPFAWTDVEVCGDGHLSLSNIAKTELTDGTYIRNLYDYAALIYCIATCSKSAEGMVWDAGGNIKQSVLRKIVRTVCLPGEKTEALDATLRKKYVGEKEFFNDYAAAANEGNFAVDNEAKADAAGQQHNNFNEERGRQQGGNGNWQNWEYVKYPGVSSGDRLWQTVKIFIVFAVGVGILRLILSACGCSGGNSLFDQHRITPKIPAAPHIPYIPSTLHYGVSGSSNIPHVRRLDTIKLLKLPKNVLSDIHTDDSLRQMLLQSRHLRISNSYRVNDSLRSVLQERGKQLQYKRLAERYDSMYQGHALE